MDIRYELVPNEKRYWNFIREVRNDERNQHGFVEKVSITEEQQNKYMEKHNDEYYVCIEKTLSEKQTMLGFINTLVEKPVGFIGSVDNDIRVAVDFDHQNQGIATFMVTEYKKHMNPTTDIAVVKHHNIASHKLFIKCGYTLIREDDDFKYYKVYEL